MSEPIGLPPNLPPGLMPFQMVQRVATEAFRVLLNTKHLYQHVEISANAVGKQLTPILRAIYGQEHLEHQIAATVHPLFQYWCPTLAPGQNASLLPRETMMFDLPTVKTFCERCEEVQPFNPQPPTLGFPCVEMRRENEQVFSVPYLCQGCKDFRLTFMVMRRDLRLTLTGRSEIEKIQVPPYIPKDVARHYSSAVLAYNCNQVLPSLFMLRTLIEQYMQSVLGRGNYKDADQLCSAYNATLDDRFKSRFPSLPVIYRKLSDALHAADEDAELFESQIREIQKHFRAKRSWEEDG